MPPMRRKIETIEARRVENSIDVAEEKSESEEQPKLFD